LKSTGMVRRIDALGRIVIPRELRRTLNIEQNTSIEIYMNNGEIILRKQEVSCALCGSTERLFTVSGKKVCETCVDACMQKVRPLDNND
jgi:transcriptional pleiotropic regulator of transition state genes